ncbi:uncharacterized protein FIBRA_08930 [Fibroporia radiculosa]|uniref:Uncharacterized protein n=1 Tax=Fibroporia radiculosa TaxID=599839 RepID=J4I3J3_9APHY|nr:uncharacterized protein FIBRA_08930 [Fibroporia radiculosa]CCM06647.1 predicted protein [Fibroporia radiculosa]
MSDETNGSATTPTKKPKPELTPGSGNIVIECHIILEVAKETMRLEFFEGTNSMAVRALIGSGNCIIMTPDGYFWIVLRSQPEQRTVTLVFTVQTEADGSFMPLKALSSDYTKNNMKVPKYVQSYMLHTEDGGDKDYHDMTLVVTVISCTK